MQPQGTSRRRRLRFSIVLVALALVVSACYVPFDLGGAKGADVSWVIDDGTTISWYLDGQAEPIWQTPSGPGNGGDPVPGDWDDDGAWEPAMANPPGVVGPGFSIDFPPTVSAGTTLCPPPLAAVPGSWDGTKGTDMGWFLHGTAEWQIEDQAPFTFGRPATDQRRCDLGVNDVPVPADYDGDGTTDAAVYQPDSGDWLVRGHDGVFTNLGVGIGLPAPADYDGDGTDEPAIYEQHTRTLTIDGMAPVTFPAAGTMAVPAPADYDGNGTDDPAVIDLDGAPVWHIAGRAPVALPLGAWPTVIRPWLTSSLVMLTFAERSCITGDPSYDKAACARDAVRGDFDGDGTADPVTIGGLDADWAWTRGVASEPFATLSKQASGLSGAEPFSADWDGDGRWDPGTLVDGDGAAQPDDTWTWPDGSSRVVAAPADCTAPRPPGTDIWPVFPIPLVGDWDGDHHDDPGWYCPIDATWHLDGVGVVAYGTPLVDTTDEAERLRRAVPVPGDYDGDGTDEPALYDPVTSEVRSSSPQAPTISFAGRGVPIAVDDRAGALTLGDGDSVIVYSWRNGIFSLPDGTTTPGPSHDGVEPSSVEVALADYDGDGTAELAILARDPAPHLSFADGTSVPVRSGDPAALRPMTTFEIIRIMYLEQGCETDPTLCEPS